MLISTSGIDVWTILLKLELACGNHPAHQNWLDHPSPDPTVPPGAGTAPPSGGAPPTGGPSGAEKTAELLWARAKTEATSARVWLWARPSSSDVLTQCISDAAQSGQGGHFPAHLTVQKLATIDTSKSLPDFLTHVSSEIGHLLNGYPKAGEDITTSANFQFELDAKPLSAASTVMRNPIKMGAKTQKLFSKTPHPHLSTFYAIDGTSKVGQSVFVRHRWCPWTSPMWPT